LNKVNHIIVVMQENRSFDNYFGALAYAPGSPYHNGNGVCASTDHKCVDGLTCTVNAGTLSCTNLTSTTTDPLSSRLKPRLVVSFPTSIIPGLALTARSTSRIRIVH
jgi:phospholipase C